MIMQTDWAGDHPAAAKVRLLQITYNTPDRPTDLCEIFDWTRLLLAHHLRAFKRQKSNIFGTSVKMSTVARYIKKSIPERLNKIACVLCSKRGT